jgi:hypothetical protein
MTRTKMLMWFYRSLTVIIISCVAPIVLSEDNGKYGIYLCTKELSNAASAAIRRTIIAGNVQECKNKTEGIYEELAKDLVRGFIPIYGFTNQKECQSKFRHCFFVLGEFFGIVTHSEGPLLHLKFLDSRGFGMEHGSSKAAVYPEDIFVQD